MKRFHFLIIVVFVIMFLTGCRSNDSEPTREFYTNFSIGKIVEDNETYLLEGAIDSSGALFPGSRVLIGSESGPPEPFIQRYEEISFQINENDHEAFVSAVKMDIQQAITDSGASVEGYSQGGGDDTNYFSFDYTHDQIFGTIHVWAVNSPDSRMNIIVLLTED
jgi:hypothetical protein